MTLETLVKMLNEFRSKRDYLKISLERKEIEEYHKWKRENEKDRTAMDKVIAMLKLDDEAWQNLEDDYINAKLNYEYLRDVYNVVLSLDDEVKEEFLKQF